MGGVSFLSAPLRTRSRSLIERLVDGSREGDSAEFCSDLVSFVRIAQTEEAAFVNLGDDEVKKRKGQQMHKLKSAPVDDDAEAPRTWRTMSLASVREKHGDTLAALLTEVRAGGWWVVGVAAPQLTTHTHTRAPRTPPLPQHPPTLSSPPRPPLRRRRPQQLPLPPPPRPRPLPPRARRRPPTPQARRRQALRKISI